MLTNEEKIALLTQAGVSVEDATEQVLGAPATVIEEASEPEHPTNCACAECYSEGVGAILTVKTGFEFEDTLKRIIGKSYADKTKALSLCDAEGKAYFDAHKVSKVQAAARGLDKTFHNKRAWDDSQKIVITLKRMVRDHYRVGSVKAKIAASKTALPQAVRDMDDAALERLLASEEFLALLNKQEVTD